MTLSVVLIILILFVLTFCLRAQDLPTSLADSPPQPFDHRKSRIYEGLRDLQFEYRLGKLSEQDYQQSKRGLQQELAKILQSRNIAPPPPFTIPINDGRHPSLRVLCSVSTAKSPGPHP
jgi:hypothetical protein